MPLINDIGAAAAGWRERLDQFLDTARDWAGSETGQQVLLGLDWLALGARIGLYYEHTGWYFPVHPSLHRHVLEHLETHAPFDPRAAVGLVGPGSEHWGWMVEAALDSPSLRERRPVCEDAVFCLENERWHAAVSTLLPVIEGLISDRSGILDGMRVGRRLEELLDNESGEWEALSAVPALSVLDAEVFDRRDFSSATIDDEALNRHLVLHGRTANFGTRENAIRTFMLLLAVVEVLDGALLLRAATAPTDSMEYLDEYGPLAALRSAAAERAAPLAGSADN